MSTPPQILTVKATPGARKPRVEVTTTEGGNVYRVYVTAPAEGGKANKAVIAALAKYLGVRKSDLQLFRGETSRDKLIKVISESS